MDGNVCQVLRLVARFTTEISQQQLDGLPHDVHGPQRLNLTDFTSSATTRFTFIHFFTKYLGDLDELLGNLVQLLMSQ